MYIYSNTHTNTHTYIHTKTHTHMYICTYKHTCTHTYIHTKTHTYTHIHKHTCTHTKIHTFTHMHTYTNTHAVCTPGSSQEWLLHGCANHRCPERDLHSDWLEQLGSAKVEGSTGPIWGSGNACGILPLYKNEGNSGVLKLLSLFPFNDVLTTQEGIYHARNGVRTWHTFMKPLGCRILNKTQSYPKRKMIWV